MEDIIRVFLCDDHALFRQGIKKLLELEKDIRIVGEANNGQEMLDMLKKTGPDIILMDISIKGSRNGLELTKELKASKEYSHIAVIAVTAHAFDKDRQNALEAGCDDYISKPFTKESLLDMIAKFV